MISLKELNPHGYTTTPEQAKNLAKLLTVMNEIRTKYGKPMTVTSGLRSDADQARINPKAKKSNHLMGLACDISDVDGLLWTWCMLNVKVLETLGVYLEDKQSTPTWVHFQITPPGSGKRVFKP